MKMLGSSPRGIQASGSPCAVRHGAGSSRTVLGGKGPLRPCLLRALLPENHSRRTAPPGTRCDAISSSYKKTKTR
jgi:hypothetical protein